MNLRRILCLSFVVLSLVHWSELSEANVDPHACRESVVRQDLKIPAAVIDQFLRPDRHSGVVYWFFPHEWCIAAGRKFTFRDESGGIVGTYEVNAAHRGEFTTLTSTLANSDPFLKGAFDALAKLELSPYGAADLALRLTYGSDEYSRTRRLVLARGSFKLQANYVLAWNRYYRGNRFNPVKDVTYEDVVRMLRDGSLVVYFVGESDLGRIGLWRIPGALQARDLLGRPTRRRAIEFAELVTAFGGLVMAGLPKDKAQPILVYSNDTPSMDAMNAATLLRAAGYTNVYWNGMMTSLWGKRDAFFGRSVRESKAISAAELRDGIAGKRLRVFDARDREKMSQGTIPGARALPSSFLPGGEAARLLAKTRAGSSSLQLNPRRTYTFVDVGAMGNRNDPMVIFGVGGESDEELYTSYNVLIQQGFTSVAVYKDGYSDWFSRSKWLASQGYRTETPRQK